MNIKCQSCQNDFEPLKEERQCIFCMTKRTPYIFVRLEGFYPIELMDDAEAIRNAECNPGTVKVLNALTECVVWENHSRN